MPTKKEKRNIIGGILVVGFILALLAVQLVRFSARYLDLIESGYYIGVVIFILGLVLVIAYVLYYD